MERGKIMSDTNFKLSPIITRSFDKGVLKKFLSKYRLRTEFERSNKEFHDFVQDYIAKGDIRISELEEYFNEELLYGNQRSIYMHEIYGNYRKTQSKQALLNRIQERYPYVESLKFHSVLQQPLNKEITELVSIKAEVGFEVAIVQRITLIFGEKCYVNLKDGYRSEYSYITIEVDFPKKLLFVKVEPKTGVNDESQKPSNLAKKYYDIVTKLFKFQYNEYVNLHKATLCNMNIELYNQVYNKMVQKQPEGISMYIDSAVKNFQDKLDICNYKEKLAHSSIFNISDILTKMVEHILITDILYESAETGILAGVEGYVTYVKFSDGTNISARIRGEDYIAPIFSSEAFMALRASINNAKKITILKISWLNEYHGTRVSYDASDNQCLEILLYKHHTKEEFEYAVRKYRECEARTIEENPTLVAMEA